MPACVRAYRVIRTVFSVFKGIEYEIWNLRKSQFEQRVNVSSTKSSVESVLNLRGAMGESSVILVKNYFFML